MPRKKHLILTYGVADGRPRTVVLSLARLNALLGVIALMATWSIGSLVYVAKNLVGERPAIADVEPVVATPQAPAEIVEAAPPVEATEPVAMQTAPEGKLEPVPEAMPAPEPVVVSEPVSVPAAQEPAPKAAPPELEAVVEGYHVTRGSDWIVTHFGIRNRSNETLRGKVHAEVDYALPDGTTTTLSAEEIYKARTLSSKRLSFKIPGPGTVQQVRITIDDQASQRSVVFFK